VPELPIIETANTMGAYQADYVSLLPGSRAVGANGEINPIREEPLQIEPFPEECPRL
jgi:hypothetical protein